MISTIITKSLSNTIHAEMLYIGIFIAYNIPSIKLYGYIKMDRKMLHQYKAFNG